MEEIANKIADTGYSWKGRLGLDASPYSGTAAVCPTMVQHTVYFTSAVDGIMEEGNCQKYLDYDAILRNKYEDRGTETALVTRVNAIGAILIARFCTLTLSLTSPTHADVQAALDRGELV